MRKIFLLSICISAVLNSCVRDGADPENVYRGCPLTVTCRDMTRSQDDNTLNIWGGYCSYPAYIDTDYLYGLDGGNGKILPVIMGYTLEYIDPEGQDVSGPVKVTAWYRPIRNDLRIEHRNIASGEIIHTTRTVENIPSGEVVNEDFLSKHNYIPVLSHFEYEWVELNRQGGAGENAVTLWYNPLFTLTVHYLDGHRRGEEDNVLSPPVKVTDVKRYTLINSYYLRNNFLYKDLYPYFVDNTEGNGWMTSDMDIIIWYITGW